jgi:TRAP-type mannitol/chloroaromatic compound transport system permease large subunit
MFIAGIFPGIMTSLMFMGYIAIRCAISPQMGPALQLTSGETGKINSSL